MNELELISFQIISAVGTAKSTFIEAMRLAEKNEFEAAEEKIKEGQSEFLEGHKAHASLIQKEAAGDNVNINMLLMHAEDQLMSAETIKIMAEEIIKLNKRIKTLEK